MLLKFTFLLLGLIALVWAAMWSARQLLKRMARPPVSQVCKCGYLLQGLSVPRCPECGRAVGFDKTFEELGIARDELKKMK